MKMVVDILSTVNHNYPATPHFPPPKHLLRAIIVANNEDFDKQPQFPIIASFMAHTAKNGKLCVSNPDLIGMMKIELDMRERVVAVW